MGLRLHIPLPGPFSYSASLSGRRRRRRSSSRSSGGPRRSQPTKASVREDAIDTLVDAGYSGAEAGRIWRDLVARDGDTLRGYERARASARGIAWKATRGASPSAESASRSALTEFHGRHWRIIWAVVFAVLPFGSLGDTTVYTDNVALNVVKFVGICAGCWVASAVFIVLHLLHRAEPEESSQ